MRGLKSGDWVQGFSNSRLHTGIFICYSLIASGLSLIASWDEKKGTKYYLNIINAINVSEPKGFPIDLPYYAIKHPDFNEEDMEGDEMNEYKSGDWVEGYNKGNLYKGIFIHTYNPDGGMDMIATWSNKGNTKVVYYIDIRGTKRIDIDYQAPGNLLIFARKHTAFKQTKEEKGKDMATTPFVNCIISECTGKWNINMRNNCPVCNTIYIGKKKRQKILKNRQKKWHQWGKNNKATHVVMYEKDDAWETDIDCVEACSKAPESVTIWVTPQAKAKIDALMEKYPRIEWLAYLIGSEYTVEDIFVPKQRVTSVSVTDIECPEYNDLDIIGVIHSHHGMGNAFSGTDHEWINQNHNISLCIAKTGVAGQVRWKTPCNSIKMVKAVTKLKIDFEFEKDGFLEAVDELVNESTYTYTYHGQSSGHTRRDVGVPVRNTSQLTKDQKSYSEGVAVVPKKDDNDVWDTDGGKDGEDEPKELDFTEEKTLEDELSYLDNNPTVETEMVGDGF